MKALKRLVFWGSIATAAAAIFQELRRPPEERQWHGEVLGIIPYDFRPPSLERFKNAWWNPDDPRLFTPRDFGVGWAINLPRVFDLIETYRHRSGDEKEAGHRA